MNFNISNNENVELYNNYISISNNKNQTMIYVPMNYLEKKEYKVRNWLRKFTILDEITTNEHYKFTIKYTENAILYYYFYYFVE